MREVASDFYLMRYLKKYAVFLSAKAPEHLFGVLALYDPFDVMARGQPLPVLFKTTLLPFKGRIIYDGLLNRYNISFGAGIRGSLNDTYSRLKETEGIIEQRADRAGAPQIQTSRKTRKVTPAPDWEPALADIVAQTEKMKQGDTAERSAALAVLRAAAQLAQACYDEDAAVDPKLKQARRALTRLEKLRFEQRY